MFLGQAGTFLSFQARRSSAKRSSASDLTVEAKCREKPEKSGLEPTAPNRLADRKHCALSTQPNPHLHVDGDLAESIKLSR